MKRMLHIASSCCALLLLPLLLSCRGPRPPRGAVNAYVSFPADDRYALGFGTGVYVWQEKGFGAFGRMTAASTLDIWAPHYSYPPAGYQNDVLVDREFEYLSGQLGPVWSPVEHVAVFAGLGAMYREEVEERYDGSFTRSYWGTYYVDGASEWKPSGVLGVLFSFAPGMSVELAFEMPGEMFQLGCGFAF
jgi:hypothetical protein